MHTLPNRAESAPVAIPRGLDAIIIFLARAARPWTRRHPDTASVLVSADAWNEAQSAIMQARYEASPEMQERLHRAMTQPRETGKVI